MKNAKYMFAILVLLALDYAALDDITTGSQPHYIFEYAMLAISVIIFAAIGYIFVKNKSTDN